MTEDKRTGQKSIPDDLKKVLNSKQMAILGQIQHLGWELKFVRMPMFLEAVPVVYNAKFDQIGILDPDGNISLKSEIGVRPCEPEQEKLPQVAASWKEKRKDIAPIPDNLDELLNQHQMRALCQIESFGWQLYYVRRPLFQAPVPRIISPEGDKVATIELDGRINLVPDSDVRKDESPEQTRSAPSAAASVGSSTDPLKEN